MSLLNYYIHYQANSPDPVAIATTQPTEHHGLIGPAAATPSVEDFRLTYCIATRLAPSKQLMESAARAVADMNAFINMRGA